MRNCDNNNDVYCEIMPTVYIPFKNSKKHPVKIQNIFVIETLSVFVDRG